MMTGAGAGRRMRSGGPKTLALSSPDHWPGADHGTDSVLGWAALLAVLAHVALMGIPLPRAEADPAFEKTREYLVLHPTPRVRIKPPERPVEIQRAVRKVPIPDPTPEDPEPIRTAEPVASPLDLAANDLVIEIPESPPPPEFRGPMEIVGDVEPPVKLYAPAPRYPELARKIRYQGTVQLRAVIDEFGLVSQVQVKTPLPYGLTEAAVDAVKQWTYSPATLDGEPVAVFLNLQVRFTLH